MSIIRLQFSIFPVPLSVLKDFDNGLEYGLLFYAPNGVCGKRESRDVYPRYDGPEAAGQREDRGHSGIETASAAEYFEVDDGGAACDSGDNGSRVHGNDGICRRA